MPNFPCPRMLVFVAVGRSNCGPTPQITLLLFFGEKKCGLHISETIDAGLGGWACRGLGGDEGHISRLGRRLCYTDGLVDDGRVMRFQSFPALSGITG